jgi:alkylation response protein AidB-like acyl-CoA dehydrogenase
MDLTLSESEQLLQDTARDFLTREVTPEVVAAVEASDELPAALWAALAEQGWFGVGIPTEQGGGGGSLVDWAILLAELGRVACPAPVVEQLTAAAYLASRPDDPRLPGVLSGAQVATLAIRDKPGAPVTAQEGPAGKATLTGAKMLVPYASAAHLLLVSGAEGAPPGARGVPFGSGPPGGGGEPSADSGSGLSGLVAAPNPLPESADGSPLGTRTLYAALDTRDARPPIEHLHTVSRDQHGLVTLDGLTADLLGEADADPRRDLIALYRIARDAFAVGLMGRILDITLEYVKGRAQFGRPIGSFQAVQYRCVDMALATYGAQNHLYQAAWLVGNGRPAARELLLFHAAVRDALGEVVANAHQAHGAMGITDAYPLQLFTRRAKVFQHSLGTAAQFRAQLAGLEESFVLPEAAEPLWGGFV